MYLLVSILQYSLTALYKDLHCCNPHKPVTLILINIAIYLSVLHNHEQRFRIIIINILASLMAHSDHNQRVSLIDNDHIFSIQNSSSWSWLNLILTKDSSYRTVPSTNNGCMCFRECRKLVVIWMWISCIIHHLWVKAALHLIWIYKCHWKFRGLKMETKTTCQCWGKLTAPNVFPSFNLHQKPACINPTTHSLSRYSRTYINVIF